MQSLVKGDKIQYKAVVKGAYKGGVSTEDWDLIKGNNGVKSRSIYRLELIEEGIFIGWTMLPYGEHMSSGREYGKLGTVLGGYPATFSQEGAIKVYVIEPADNNDNRYYRPVYVLPEDIIDNEN